MNKLQLDKLNNANNKRFEKYNILKDFEKKQIGKDFKSSLEEGFNKDNPKYKYINYLRYFFLPFAFKNEISSNDLNLLAIQKNEIGLIYYSIYQIAIKLEEVHPREITHWFLQSYMCLGKISSNPKKDILFFLEKTLLKENQTEFIIDIFNNYDLHYKGFIGTYEFITEPYFHFKYK